MSVSDIPYGVYVSLVTPFKNDEVAFDLLEENIKRMNRTSIRGYLALGGNAESYGMSEAEHLQIIRTVREHAVDRQLIVGVAAESTHLTCEKIKPLKDWGADYVRVLPPHYFAKNMSQDVLYRFYSEVADASCLPIMLYHVPRLTNGVEFSPELVYRLASHPNIKGIKDSSSDGIYGFIGATRTVKDFAVLSGSANSFFPALVAGADGGDMTLANYLPEFCCRLYDEFQAGNLENAKRLHFTLYTINKLVSGKLGIPGIKASMDIMGYFGGEPRRPILPLEPADADNLRKKINSIIETFEL